MTLTLTLTPTPTLTSAPTPTPSFILIPAHAFFPCIHNYRLESSLGRINIGSKNPTGIRIRIICIGTFYSYHSPHSPPKPHPDSRSHPHAYPHPLSSVLTPIPFESYLCAHFHSALQFIYYSDIFYTAIFFAEAIMKIIAWTFLAYISRWGWDCHGALVLCTSFIAYISRRGWDFHGVLVLCTPFMAYISSWGKCSTI